MVINLKQCKSHWLDLVSQRQNSIAEMTQDPGQAFCKGEVARPSVALQTTIILESHDSRCLDVLIVGTSSRLSVRIDNRHCIDIMNRRRNGGRTPIPMLGLSVISVDRERCGQDPMERLESLAD